MSDDMTTQVFKEEAFELLGELESSLLELEDLPDDMDLINRVFRALHTIKGSGSMFGFDAIAGFTHHVETVFDMVRNGDLPITKELLTLVLSSRDHIYTMLQSPSGEGEAGQGDSILEGLRIIASGDSADEVLPDTEMNAAVEVDTEDFEAEKSKIEDSKIDDADVEEVLILDNSVVWKYLFKIIISSDEADDVSKDALLPLFEELARIGEIKSEVVFTDFENNSSHSGIWWEVLFLSNSDSSSIEEIFFFTDVPITVKVCEQDQAKLDEYLAEIKVEIDKPDTSIEELAVHDSSDDENFGPPVIDKSTGVRKLGEILVDRGDLTQDTLNEALADQKPIGELLAAKGVVTRDKIDSALAEQSASKETVATRRKMDVTSSLRVSAEKLDLLVDLVGELVIVQAQICQVVGEKNDPSLTALSEELERLSDELRDSTLGIRMLPIGTTFSKFRRLVRDLSDELGKEIDLHTIGAETELDKTVIERLGDPLIHLLRNSIDHGVELPAVRESKGKSRRGNITLTAEHSGGEVVILIKDDGKGISKDVIFAKAVEKGIVTADAELTTKEVFNLIFEPGFSTAESVTSVSGRGVGMDVVKRAIDSLRGRIDIDSQEGKGSLITIRLPLTLAIIDGLQVKVEDGYFVIPLSLVEECVELTRKNVEEANGQQFVNLRGEIVPYIRIREWFDIEGESPPIEQIVITGLEGSRIGVVVDTVIGEHQTVIKSLGRVYRDVEGISGATIKGDGTLALILDIPKLFRTVLAEIKAAC
ncbi:chemotaxis protein CheA [Maridesulfovibrio ferrireducens]|uniref:chemotaxis protein CheA n=1 Tax=Maridesulfovibrio ferrireducens TaxID=246191 RepID=UPI001A2A5D3E|nr:chemotaxis protein CheA [Maridesulfovibrio ferrireducens]MBI9110167.1 chemotaxis protein CheA [Maridesulfovibrio ferrireducens]